MSEPKRLSSVSDGELERLLIRSGRLPAPLGSRRRALAAATAALGTPGLAAGTAAASGAAMKATSVLSLKWLGVVCAAGLGAMTAAVAITDHRLANEPPGVGDDRASVPAKGAGIQRTAPAAVPSAQASGTIVATAEPVTAQPSPASSVFIAGSPTPTKAAPAASSGPSVRAELTELEHARMALSRGDPATALSILDAYAVKYPRGMMEPEAATLRIDALVEAGDMPAAQRAGRAFLESHPRSPYAERVGSLIGATNP